MSPAAPVVGVGGVVVRDGRVLLIRRGKPPLYGRWVVPGGTVELGETLEEALVREMEEETSLRVEPIEVLTVFDRIEREGERVVYHYVIVDYLCRWLLRRGEGGVGRPRRGVGDPGASWPATTCPPKAAGGRPGRLPAGSRALARAPGGPRRRDACLPRGDARGYPRVVLARSGSQEGMMKRLAMAAFLLLAATSARTEAGSLPKPKSVIDRDTADHTRRTTSEAAGEAPRAGPRRQPRSHRGLRLTHAVRGK